jgi:hypothetical protein
MAAVVVVVDAIIVNMVFSGSPSHKGVSYHSDCPAFYGNSSNSCHARFIRCDRCSGKSLMIVVGVLDCC